MEKDIHGGTAVRDRLKDVDVLQDHHPELLGELREVVCSGPESITTRDVTITEGDRYEVVGPVPVENAEQGREFIVQDIVTPIGDEEAALLIRFADKDGFHYTPLYHASDAVDDGRLDLAGGDHA